MVEIRRSPNSAHPTRGEIRLNGQLLNHVPANRRPTCMVFQDLALFPHKSVGENIEFPLKIAGVSPAVRRERASALLRQLRLPVDYYGKGVNQCSGGERQRIALARALAFDPQILFFDEPLTALDFRLRKTLEKELKDIHRETGKTFVYITHSLEEAMVMSDRIGIMKDGELVQIGTPHEIYNRPVNKFVAQFMGEVNVLEVEAAGAATVREVRGEGTFAVRDMPERFTRGFLIIRPEVMKLGSAALGVANTVFGRLFNDYALGSRIQYQVRSAAGAQWLVERLQDDPFGGAPDADLPLGWRPEDSVLGVQTSWHTAVFAHMIWIVPIVILIMSIQIYSFDPTLEEAAYDLGASRWQVLREVTLPILSPGLVSGAIFAFLLSWGNFPLSLFSTGADQTVPEWLYSKMVSGYIPMVPTLGALTMASAALLLLLAWLVWLSIGRSRRGLARH